jgi:hypothetical protein
VKPDGGVIGLDVAVWPYDHAPPPEIDPFTHCPS